MRRWSRQQAETFRAHLDALPSAITERLAARGLEGSVRTGI